MQSFPKAQPNLISVTYVCDQGHHDIRHWRVPCPVHPEHRLQHLQGTRDYQRDRAPAPRPTVDGARWLPGELAAHYILRCCNL